MHELSLSSAIVDTVERHADGRRVTAVNMRIGALRQVVPDSLAFYFEIVVAGDGLRGRPPGARAGRCAAPLSANASTSGTPRLRPWRRHGGPLDAMPALPTFRCPECGSGGGEVLSGGRVRGRVDRGGSERSRRRSHAPHQGEGRRGRPRRQRDDRPRQPRRLRPRLGQRRQPDERPRRRQDVAARAAPREPRRHPGRRARGRRAGKHGRRPDRGPARPGDAAQHRPELRRRVPPGRQHGALGDLRRCRSTRSTCW